jgi:hypothetical protein
MRLAFLTAASQPTEAGLLGSTHDVTTRALDVLELVAVLCGLALFVFAATALLLATYRVAVRGRVLILPFGGNDERRVELTDLFVRRLTEIEESWVRLAREIAQTKKHVNEQALHASLRRETKASKLLVDGGAIPPVVGAPPASAGSAPRSSGDELFGAVIQLGGVGSLANADLGVVGLAGVSFSPRDVLALLRAAPGVFARRILRGSILVTSGGNLVSVEYEERGVRRRERRSHVMEVGADRWLPAIE